MDPQAIVQRARATGAQIQQGLSPALVSIGQPGLEAAVIPKLAIADWRSLTIAQI